MLYPTSRRVALALALLPMLACSTDDTADDTADDTGNGTDSAADASVGDASSGDADAGADGAVDDAAAVDTGTPDTVVDDTASSDTATDGAQGDSGSAAGPTFEELHAGFFAVSCADLGCHYGVALDFSAPEGLADRLLASASQADMPLITPGNLDASYLWHKVSGTHEAAGGSGVQMPLNGSITDSQFDLLENYIMITLTQQ